MAAHVSADAQGVKDRYITGLGDRTSYDALYLAARDYYSHPDAGNEPDTVAAVDTLAAHFAGALHTSTTQRFTPYFPMLEAMQRADPSMHLPRREAVWNAAKLLCDHVGINFDKFQQQPTIPRRDEPC